MKKRFRIFISSPGDVGKEREAALEVIQRVGNMMRHHAELSHYIWELEPMLAHRDFQESIEDPADFDLVLCLLWSRLGTPLPEKYVREDGSRYLSGTEYEFEQARAAREARLRAAEKALIQTLDLRPDLLVYRRTTTPYLPLDATDYEERQEQWKRVNGFVKKWFFDPKDQTLVVSFKPYDNLDQFVERLQSDLVKYVREKLSLSGEMPEFQVARSSVWDGEGPYVGAAPFEFRQAQIFSGRLRAVDEVLNQLTRRAEEQKLAFVAISGGSGTGKSSLLRAGVLPWLVRPGIVRGIAIWRYGLLCLKEKGDGEGADSDPLLQLAEVLFGETALPELAETGLNAADFAALLRAPPEAITDRPEYHLALALNNVAAKVKLNKDLVRQPAARLAIGIDQLEHLDPESKLGAALLALARSGAVWIVAAMRSDSAAALTTALPGLLAEAGVYHLAQPEDAELAQMIRRPAELAGIAFEERQESDKGRLDDALLREAERNRDALPQLQEMLFSFYQTIPAGGGQVFTHAQRQAYGLAGLLAARAEALPALKDAPEGAFEAVFAHLIALPDEAGSGPERRVAWREVVVLAAEGAEALLDALVAARLVTVWADPGQSRVRAAVTHEALLADWERIRKLIQKDGKILRLRTRVSEAAKVWRQEKCRKSFLWWHGEPLKIARLLLQEHRPLLDEEEAAFLEASLSAGKLAGKGAIALAAVLVVMMGIALFSALASRETAGKLKLSQEQQQKILELQGQVRKWLGKAADPVGQEALGVKVQATGNSDMQTLKKVADDLLEIAPQDVLGLEARARAALLLHAWDDAAAGALAWRKQDAAHAWRAHLLEGDAAWLQKHAEAAQQSWVQAQALSPASVEAASRLALAAEAAGKWPDAAQQLGIWITQADNAEARRRRAEALLHPNTPGNLGNLDRYQQAVDDMKAARSQHRNDAQISRRWPFFENLASALPELKKCSLKLSTNPGDADAGIAFSLALLEAGLDKEAAEVASRQWPDSPRITALRSLFTPPLVQKSASVRAQIGREQDEKLRR